MFKMEEILAFTLLMLIGISNGHILIKDSAGLYDFPKKVEIFANCTKIQLRYNYISYIPENALCHVKDLWYLNLERNRLTEIGNLSCIGQSLTHIYFHYNQISTIASNAFFNLTNLRLLYLYNNRLTQMPDISLVTKTLTHLRVDSNVGIRGYIPDGYFDHVPLVVLGLSNLGFQSFPNISIFKPTLRYFYFNHNKLPFSVLNEYHQLQVLHLYDIGISAIPFLKLDKLYQLQLGGNDLGSASQEDYRNLELPNLRQYYISNAKLTSLPKVLNPEKITDLSISGNPIPFIHRRDMNRFEKLQVIHSTSMTNLKYFSCASHRTISYVNLHRSGLSSLLQICHCSQRVLLHENKLTSLSPISASLLRYNRELILSNNNLHHISDYVDLEYAADTKLNLIGNKDLDLCRCEHVWLKIATEKGAKIDVDDTVCENNENWKNMSVSTLLELCNDTMSTDESQSGWSDERRQASSCELPVHFIFKQVHLQHCATLCLQQKGCVAYKFNFVTGRIGDCQLLIPKQPQITIPPNVIESKCFLVARE